ncbi:caspase recruitment domain-containing protein 8-like [Carettochelys insculpta]|uniref:caspase recruitment domain-containing protein 8-like n=1 Tax=Carettochelys insculpta TaxID=44489 RepID=UPI003EB91A76
MRKLYELMPSWDREFKDRLYELLKKTNTALIKELEEGHFVDWHREPLIRRVSNVDALCRKVLSNEQCRSVVTDPLKMWKLYELVPHWELWRKDRLHQALRETNRALVEELEGKHFIDRHREQLIQCVSQVDRVLNYLQGKVLSKKQCWDIRTKRVNPQMTMMTTQGPMPPLYIEAQGFTDLESTPVLQGGPARYSWNQKLRPSATTGVRVVGESLHSSVPPFLTTHRDKAGKPRQCQNLIAYLRGWDKCDRCVAENEGLSEEVKPEIIQDPDGNHETYRLRFSKPGWFRCSETDLQFEVRAAVTIQFEYSSWRKHMTELQQEQWMVASPLFDIRVEPAGAVAAVHLPHFLCLREADNSRMKIARFVDEGMTLESPTWVRPFHAVLQNPGFSLIGVLWQMMKKKKKKSPVHSIVLLYQSQKRVNLTLHLYLIPDDSSRIKAVEVYEHKCKSCFVSKSHFTTKPLCFGSCYIVSSPSKITVTPKELPYLNACAEVPQPFIEIHTKDGKKELELSLVEKSDEKPIWQAVIRPEDLMPSVSSTEMQTETHFVNQHREQLIQRVTAVDGVLDLLCGRVLDTEQYQSVRAEKTNPSKMRKLYELVPSWNTGCKDQFYQALKEKHRHLVEELEGR